MAVKPPSGTVGKSSAAKSPINGGGRHFFDDVIYGQSLGRFQGGFHSVRSIY